MVKIDYVWDRTVEFLGDRLSAILPIALLAIFLPLSVMNSLGPSWASAEGGVKAVLALCYVVAMLAVWWGSLAITAMAVGNLDRAAAGATASRRYLAMVGVYVVVGIVGALLLLPAGVLAGIAGFDVAALQRGQAAPAASPGLALTAVLYALVVIILFIVAAARLIPLAAVIVAERRGVGAISRAFAMTRGMTWRLIGVVILYAVVSQVAALAVQTVFGSILGFFDRDDSPLTIGKVLTAIAVAAVSAGFSVVAAAFAAKLYVAIQQKLDAPAAEPIRSDPTAS